MRKKFIDEYVGPIYAGLAIGIPFIIAANPTVGMTVLTVALLPWLFVGFYKLFNLFLGGEK